MAEGTTGLPTDANGVKQAGLFDGTNFYHARRDPVNLGMLLSLKRAEAQSNVNIASGTTSEALDLQGFAEAAIALPSTFEGTSLTFTAATTTGGGYKPVYDEYGILTTIAVAAGNCYYLPRSVVVWPFIKIVSNVSVAASRQIAVTKLG